MVRSRNYTEARSHIRSDSRSQWPVVSHRAADYPSPSSSKYPTSYSSRDIAKRKYPSDSTISSSSRPHFSDRKPTYIDKTTAAYIVRHTSRRSPERKRMKIMASSSSRNEKYRSRADEAFLVPPPPPLLSLKLPERRFIRERAHSSSPLPLSPLTRREVSPPPRRVALPPSRRVAPPPSRRISSPPARRVASPPPRRVAPPPPRRVAPTLSRRLAPPTPRRVEGIVRRREDIHHRREEIRRRVPLKSSGRTIIPSSSTSRTRLISRGTHSAVKLKEGLARKRLVDSRYTVKKRVLVRPSDSRRLNVTKMRSVAGKTASRRGSRERDVSKRVLPKTRKEKSKEEEPPKPEKKVEEDTKVAKPKSEDETEDNKKTYIELKCPHCHFKAQTFRRYELHLLAKKHLLAMKQLAQKQKLELANMRATQRSAQNELEKNSDDLTKRTTFCTLCQLNYKQKKSLHQLSESHKKMKKFLLPQCKICNVTFKNPMTYENHCCSIKHLKRKERVENASESEASSVEEVDLKNFTLIDSIEEEEEEVSDSEDTKQSILNIGIEQIQKIEIYHCNLCKVDLPREGNVTENLSKHCKLRNHMKKYIKFKENQDIEKRAEQLQRQELALKGAKVENSDELVIKAEEKDITEVEKDLANILVKAESDDDCQLNGERYDRFKLSENNDEEEEVKSNGNPDKKETKPTDTL